MELNDQLWIRWIQNPWRIALFFGLLNTFLTWVFFSLCLSSPFIESFIYLFLHLIITTCLAFLFFNFGIRFFFSHLEDVTSQLHSDNKDLESLHRATAFGLASLTVARDQSTETQFNRIGKFSVILAKELRSSSKLGSYITDQYLSDLEVAAALHDIGRIALPDQILHKGSSLTMNEHESMRMHVIVGGDLIEELQSHLPPSMNPRRSVYSLAKEICYHHHQQWDGKGYPFVLKENGRESYFIQEGIGRPLHGDEIPLSARIVAVADVYNALISSKKWRAPFSHEEALEQIQAYKGTQFDPEITEAFLRCQREIKYVVEIEEMEYR